MKFAIICNPENRRSQFFIDAVLAEGFDHPVVISYLDLLQDKLDLFAQLKDVDVLKIDSFGENFEVRKHLLALASPLRENHISEKMALELEFDKGRIQFAKQQYLGFEQLLKSIQSVLSQLSNIQLMNTIDDILLLFDKARCHRFLSKKEIPVIPAIYDVDGFDALILAMEERSWSRVFVKANYGSSASGVIALRRNGDKIQAITSADLVSEGEQVKLYNSLKISVYRDVSSIKTIVDFLAKDGLLVEQWIPKDSSESGVYDFRVMVIDGQPKQVIARQSKMPMTNLHLGNQRGDLLAIRQKLGKAIWAEIEQLAMNTARAFPNSLYLGLDILVSKNKKVFLIEANAFGDLLPNVWVDGKDTYQTTVAHYKSKQNA